MKRIRALVVLMGLLISSPLIAAAEVFEGMVDTCTTLEGIDAAEVTGMSFSPPSLMREMDAGAAAGVMSACNLTESVDGKSAMKKWYLTFEAWTWADPASAHSHYTMSKRPDKRGTPARDVEGLGDGAFYNGILHVRYGNITLTMDIEMPSGDERHGKEATLETELAKRALAKLVFLQ